MKTKRRQPPIRTDVSIEHEGKRYTGYYTIEHDIITVCLTGGRSKSAQVGLTPPDSLATLILGELVIERRRP
jgi:hypothetical protein